MNSSSIFRYFRNIHRILLNKNTMHSNYRLFTQDTKISSEKAIDHVILALRSAPRVYDILKIVSIHHRHMEPSHVASALKALCDAQKRESYRMTQEDVLQSDEFKLLCKRLKSHIRSFDKNDLLIAFKAVTFFKVPYKSAVTQSLLHMIKNDINDLSIPQLIFVTFLLEKYPSSPIIDALRIAIPLVVEAQLKTKLDRKNVGMLVDTLKYCTFTGSRQECADFVITALSELDHIEWLTMDPRRACNVVNALAVRPSYSVEREAVFKEAVNVYTNNLNSFHFQEVDFSLTVLSKAIKSFPYLFYQPLFDGVADLAVKMNWALNRCSMLLKKLNNAGVPSKNLLNHMANAILTDPEDFRASSFGPIKSFVNGLSIANYKTDYWNVLKDLIPTCACFDHVRTTEPWLSLCLELASLDIYSDKVLNVVFSDAYLEEFLSRDYNKIDLLQLLTLHQTVSALYPNYQGCYPNIRFLNQATEINGCNFTEFPLESVLAHALGGKEHVLTRCYTENGIFIDHVLVLQARGQAVAYPDFCNQTRIEMTELSFPRKSTRLAIRWAPSSWYNAHKQLRGVHILSQKVLESYGYVVVNISQDSWMEMPDWEKSPYVMQKINLKYSEFHQKLESMNE